MSGRSFTILRLLLIVATGGGYLYAYLSMIDDESFTNDFTLSFFGILFLIIAIWSFSKDKKKYNQNKNISSYFPTVITGLFIIAAFATQRIMIARDSSPVLLKAGYDGGFNAAWFEFREDGTYEFVNSGGIGATYTRGKYRLTGDNIILDRDSLDGAMKTKYLLIRAKEREEFRRNPRSPLPEMMLYQVDSDNNIVDRGLAFVVHEDNRKN